MSLNRDEWYKIWNSLTAMENYCKQSLSLTKRLFLMKEIAFMKKEIQKVIGQME